MALKDLVINQQAFEEDLIEEAVSPYARYDPKQKSIILIISDDADLGIPQKIVLYLLALKGWKFFEGGEEIPQEATPKEIGEKIQENGSTVRNHLQTLLGDGVIYKSQSGKYTILPQSIYKVKKLLKVNL